MFTTASHISTFRIWKSISVVIDFLFRDEHLFCDRHFPSFRFRSWNIPPRPVLSEQSNFRIYALLQKCCMRSRNGLLVQGWDCSCWCWNQRILVLKCGECVPPASGWSADPPWLQRSSRTFNLIVFCWNVEDNFDLKIILRFIFLCGCRRLVLVVVIGFIDCFRFENICLFRSVQIRSGHWIIEANSCNAFSWRNITRNMHVSDFQPRFEVSCRFFVE